MIPTSLSNADLAPTESFIKSMDKVKARYNQVYPHLVVCPTKYLSAKKITPLWQKDYQIMTLLLDQLLEI